MKTIAFIVNHLIFLGREDRYNLVAGVPIEAIGVSVPVWIVEKKGKTTNTEPAVEVFCNYLLLNDKKEKLLIETCDKKYQINMPQLPSDWKAAKPMSDNKWRKMSLDQQMEWYDKNSPPPTAKCLLDYADGGSGVLRFHYIFDSPKGEPHKKEAHFIEINRIEILEQSLEI